MLSTSALGRDRALISRHHAPRRLGQPLGLPRGLPLFRHCLLRTANPTTQRKRNVPSPFSSNPNSVPPTRCSAAIFPVCRLRAAAVFLDRGHFQAVAGLTFHRVYTASGGALATYLTLWLWFYGTAEPPITYGSLLTQPEPATWPPRLFLSEVTPSPTPPRVAPPASVPTPRDAPGAPCPHPSSPMPVCSDTGGAGASSPPTPELGSADAVLMLEVADTTPGADEMQTTRTRIRGDSPAYTPRARYGPQAPTIFKTQLQRGLWSICTHFMRSQWMRVNVAMCQQRFKYPWAVRPATQPRWSWTWISQADCGFISRTEKRRAHLRMCFVCRCAAFVGS